MAGGSLSTSGFNCQVGLRGATNTDFNNRSSFGLFDQSTAGTANNASQVIGVTSGVGVFMPPDGLTYRWSPRCTGTPVTPAITANTNTICAGDTLKFSGTGTTPYFDITYQWQASTNPNGPFTNVTGQPGSNTLLPYAATYSAGVYFYVLVSTCSNVPSFAISNTIAVNVKPLPVISIFANPVLNTTVSPVETCAGETYTFYATGANGYNWLNGPATDSYVVQPSGNPSYTVIGTSVDGCTAASVVDILVNPTPVINILASPDTICPGKPTVVGVSGTSATYQWYSPNSTAFLITVSPTVTTTYSVWGTAATGCTNTATKKIVVHNILPLVVNSSSNADAICRGDAVTFSATGSNNYAWTAPGMFANGQTITVTPTISTTYSINATDLNGCESKSTIFQSVAACTGVREQTSVGGNIGVYPNPTSGKISVELNNGAPKIFELSDVTGKMVLSIHSDLATTELDLAALQTGIYFLRTYSNNNVLVTKIVKQ
jgi:hypothetical protein